MKVKDLLEILKSIQDQDAVIDLASDEEGNSFGDISEELSYGWMTNGKKVYTLWPENTELGEDRYRDFGKLYDPKYKEVNKK